MPSQILISQDFLRLFNLIHLYGYLVIFPLVVIEGPITIFISGFFISLGFLSPTSTFITVVLADLASDIIYYAAGRWWLHSTSNKILAFFKFTPKGFAKFKSIFIRHKGKIMFFGKLSSFVGGVVMYVAGLVKIPFPEFIAINIFNALFKSIILLFAGYFLGGAVVKLGASLDWITGVGLLILSGILFLIYWGVTTFANKFIRRTENG